MKFSSDSSKFIIDANLNNNLADLGLPFVIDSDQLHINERTRLLVFGHKVLETAILSKYNLKSNKL